MTAHGPGAGSWKCGAGRDASRRQISRVEALRTFVMQENRVKKKKKRKNKKGVGNGLAVAKNGDRAT